MIPPFIKNDSVQERPEEDRTRGGAEAGADARKGKDSQRRRREGRFLLKEENALTEVFARFP